MPDDDLERIASGYRAFADEAAAESPLYGRLAAAVAEDGEILRFLGALPVGKRQPNLLFAAVQYLHGVPEEAGALRDVVLAEGPRLAAVMRERATQTNEPARCTALLPLLTGLGPLALIEVGASAGLCLYPDHYSYDFDGRPVGERSSVHLSCVTRGNGPSPRALPDVVARIGIDLNPLDPADPADRAWLRALVWPGPHAADRLVRLEAAAAIAARNPATMLRGDMVDRLPEAVGLVPEDCTAVVFHTAVLPYLPGRLRNAFVEQVRSLPVRWIAQEAAGMVPGTGEPYPGGWGPYFVLSLDGRALAHTAPHGGRIDWLPGADAVAASGA